MIKDITNFSIINILDINNCIWISMRIFCFAFRAMTETFFQISRYYKRITFPSRLKGFAFPRKVFLSVARGIPVILFPDMDYRDSLIFFACYIRSTCDFYSINTASPIAFLMRDYLNLHYLPDTKTHSLSAVFYEFSDFC